MVGLVSARVPIVLASHSHRHAKFALPLYSVPLSRRSATPTPRSYLWGTCAARTPIVLGSPSRRFRLTLPRRGTRQSRRRWRGAARGRPQPQGEEVRRVPGRRRSRRRPMRMRRSRKEARRRWRHRQLQRPRWARTFGAVASPWAERGQHCGQPAEGDCLVRRVEAVRGGEGAAQHTAMAFPPSLPLMDTRAERGDG